MKMRDTVKLTSSNSKNGSQNIKVPTTRWKTFGKILNRWINHLQNLVPHKYRKLFSMLLKKETNRSLRL